MLLPGASDAGDRGPFNEKIRGLLSWLAASSIPAVSDAMIRSVGLSPGTPAPVLAATPAPEQRYPQTTPTPMSTPPPMGGPGSGRGGGYRLTPYEASILGALNAGVAEGMDPRVASEMLMGTIGGAVQRREENVATRNEGILGLQQMAAEMAASGAAPGELASAISGMAQGLPGIRGPGQAQLEGLIDYVYGMYPTEQYQPEEFRPGMAPRAVRSEISGLVPAEQRAMLPYQAESARLGLQEQALGLESQGLSNAAQAYELGQILNPEVLDEEDRAGIGTRVVEQMRQGVPFKTIRQTIQQDAAAVGYTPEQLDAVVRYAEEVYERATGVSLSEMREVGDILREQQYAQGDEWRIPDIGGTTGQELYEAWVASGQPEMTGSEFDITGLLGWLAAADPEALRRLVASPPQSPELLQDPYWREWRQRNPGVNPENPGLFPLF